MGQHWTWCQGCSKCLSPVCRETVSFLLSIATAYFCHGSECWSRRVLEIVGKAEAARGLLMALVQQTGLELGEKPARRLGHPRMRSGRADGIFPPCCAMLCCATGLLEPGNAGVVAPHGRSSRDHLFRLTDCYKVCPSQCLWPKLKMCKPETLRSDTWQ